MNFGDVSELLSAATVSEAVLPVRFDWREVPEEEGDSIHQCGGNKVRDEQ